MSESLFSAYLLYQNLKDLGNDDSRIKTNAVLWFVDPTVGDITLNTVLNVLGITYDGLKRLLKENYEVDLDKETNTVKQYVVQYHKGFYPHLCKHYKYNRVLKHNAGLLGNNTLVSVFDPTIRKDRQSSDVNILKFFLKHNWLDITVDSEKQYTLDEVCKLLHISSVSLRKYMIDTGLLVGDYIYISTPNVSYRQWITTGDAISDFLDLYEDTVNNFIDQKLVELQTVYNYDELTIASVAKLFGYSYNKIFRLIEKGVFLVVKRGNIKYISYDQVENFIVNWVKFNDRNFLESR